MGTILPFDLLIFAILAAVLVLRLRSVLGRRTGHERPPQRPTAAAARAERAADGRSDTVVSLPDKRRRGAEEGAAPTGDPLQDGLAKIRGAEPGFEGEEFLTGARAAFEMIVNAYADGDLETLRPLLSDEVFDNFAQAVKERQDNKHTLETTLVGIRNAELIEATMEGRVAFLTAKLVSEQINVTRDATGNVVDGDPGQIATVTDIWTFARNTRSRNPNWTLVATDAPN